MPLITAELFFRNAAVVRWTSDRIADDSGSNYAKTGNVMSIVVVAVAVAR